MTPTQTSESNTEIPRVETAEDAQTLCARLLETTAELVGLLDRETGHLKQGKPREIGSLQVRKAALNAMLTRDMTAFRRDADFITMAAPDEIGAIREQHAQMQKSIAANQDALTAMKAVSESLLHTIAAKAGARSSGPEVYGRDADVSTKAPSRPAPISVNTVL